jgi:hypothetical protein
MKKITLGLAMLSLLTATSCEKEKEDKSALEINNVAGNYKVTGVTMLSGATESDVSEFFMQACDRDDILNLKTDKTFAVVDAGIQCAPPNNENGTWDLPGNNKLVLDGEVADVKKWDGKQLHISREEIIFGQNATVTFKLEKQ